MCYTKEASISAFFIGFVSSLLLIFFGNKEYKLQNIGIGLLFLFVSFMQLFDYMMYIDPNCKSGWNKLAGYLGPLFNAVQPLILFVFLWFISDNQQIKYTALVVNMVYLIYILVIYIQYLNKNKICSFEENGRLTWSWYLNGFDNVWNKMYLFVLVFNLLFLLKYKYILIAGILGLVFFMISVVNYKYHVGEFWCFLVNSIPLIILALQKIIR
jgi:hypothetical protein